jgi:Family of unknown function (DUF6600)
MIKHTLKWAALLSVIAGLSLFFPQRAAANDEDDPPARVARLSYTSGAVSFSPAGTDDWVSAVINRPVTTGDKLWTDQGARAELSIGTAYIRLADQTGFSFLNLDDRTTQIRVTEGTISLRVRSLDQDEIFEVDTPNLAFSVLRPGSYRIDVNENGDATIIAVRGGEGEVTGGGSAYTIHSDEVGTFNGTDQISADIGSIAGDDDFDTWCANRDRRYERSISARYVSDDVIGYEDLDDYGGWRTVPDYGYVWFPHTTVVGWAPYRYGHWVWISPWGWTWVDDEPWGFAPFHYGRWVVVRGVWGWVPCPPRPRVVTAVYVRPVYAPALVAWVGGPHWSVGVAVGGGPANVAWFPLGPRDVYCPSYHVSQRYVERVNISNTTVINRTYVTNVYNNVYVNRTVNVTNIRYQNQRVSGAVTATSRTVFTSAQPVGRHVIRVNEREIESAPVAPRTPGMVPEQRSVIGMGAEARVRPPARVVSRQVVVKTAPPPAPVSFIRQRQAVQSNDGRPISITRERQLQPANEQVRSNIRVAPPVRVVPPQNGMGNRPGQPAQVQPHPPARTDRPVTVQPQPPARTERPVVNPPQQQGTPRDNVNRGRYNDRPPTARPSGVAPVNPQLEQKQQQQMEKLRQQQDVERQRVEQRQIQDQQKLQKQNADQQKEQMMQQRQQQQLEQVERKHQDQAQKLEQKQQREVQKQQKEVQKKEKPSREKPSGEKPKNERGPSDHHN